GERHDEIGDLVRDFDRMTVRIQDLLESQRRLLRDISHDLRSPLQRLRVALGLARRHDATLDSQLDRIERDAIRIDALVEQLLTLAKLDSGIAPPAMSRLALNDLIEKVVSDERLAAEPTGRIIAVNGDRDVWVRGNEELLRSAFENIVRNAIRYTNVESSVE